MTTKYKNKCLFLRKSKKGNHLFAFAGKYSLVMSVEEVVDLVNDDINWVKVSVLKKEKETE